MPDLFEPTEINGMRLENRLVRSATWSGLAEGDGRATSRMTDLLVGLARGGAGLIVTGHAYVRKDGKSSLFQLGAHSDKVIPSLRLMTRAVHDSRGRIALQLGFGGLYLSTTRLGNLTGRDIRDIVTAFAQAAGRAVEAEFDAIQILGAHGFLLSQFLSPVYNPRTDEFGGSVENRARALIEAVEAIRETVGGGFPVMVKLNCQDFVENGLTLEDSIATGKLLEKAGADAIELSGGLLNHLSQGLMKRVEEDEEAYFRTEAVEFKKEVNLPLILVGGIRSFEVAQHLVETGAADYISMCRPFIREPDLVNRWMNGDRPKAACISCNHCFDSAGKGEGISCAQEKGDDRQTFFPQVSTLVNASPPYPPDTSYQISLGLELWDPVYVPVVRIQVVRDGAIVQNSAPSFPLDSDDFQRVSEAVKKLLEEHASNPD